MNKMPFFLDALRITFCCAAISVLVWLLGGNNKTILVVFAMTVMSAAATFVPQQKPTAFIVAGSSTVIVAVILGGILGFYLPFIAKILGVGMAGLAFYLPTQKANSNISINSVVMFVIFSSLPFPFAQAWHYLVYGVLVVLVVTGLHYISEKTIYKTKLEPVIVSKPERVQIALTAVIAMVLGWLCSLVLHNYTAVTHLYWIPLTILVVLKGSQGRVVRTSLHRVLVNISGAIFIVIAFTYFIPQVFWINLVVLTVFLYLIFALGFSNTFRTLFIELFVLGFTHLLGNFHYRFAYDRVVLTFIGAVLVILTTLTVSYLLTTKAATALDHDN